MVTSVVRAGCGGRSACWRWSAGDDWAGSRSQAKRGQVALSPSVVAAQRRRRRRALDGTGRGDLGGCCADKLGSVSGPQEAAACCRARVSASAWAGEAA